VTVGREWYMHAIYTVKAVNQRRKRSLLYVYNSLVSHSGKRVRRATLADTIGKNFNRGTQMKHVQLEKRKRRSSSLNPEGSDQPTSPNESGFPIIYILAAAGAFVVILALILAIVLVRRRKKALASEDKKARYTGGKHIVVRQKTKGKAKTTVKSQRSSSGYSSSDTSEV